MSYITTASLLENGTLWKVETRKNLRGWVTVEAWEIDGVRYEIRYAYDDAGNRASMTYPDGTTVSFEYNERNQLVRIPGFFERSGGRGLDGQYRFPLRCQRLPDRHARGERDRDDVPAG